MRWGFPIQIFINILETLTIVVLLVRSLWTPIVYKIKKKAVPNSSFWFYLFFLISLFVADISSKLLFVGGYQLQHDFLPTIRIQDLNYSLLFFFKSLFSIGSLIFLQMYCYKSMLYKKEGDPYDPAMRGQTKKFQRLEIDTKIFVVTCMVCQFILILIYPIFKEAPELNSSVVYIICNLLALRYLFYLRGKTTNYRVMIHTWIVYEFLNVLLIPTAVIFYKLNLDSNYQVLEELIGILHLILKLGQVSILVSSVCRFSDMRALYDRDR